MIRELNPAPWAEHGRLTGAWRRGDGALAVASDFGYLYWPARGVYNGHRLRHRVTLHLGGRRVGCFDRARYPVRDVAFHPARPLVAIGTGAYDGGRFYEGELWLWDVERDEAWSVLGASREVVRCRFVSDARLALLLQPPTDEEAAVYGGVLDDWTHAPQPKGGWGGEDPRLSDFAPVDPAGFGFTASDAASDAAALTAARPARGRVWDVAWDGDAVLAAHDAAAVEAWSLDGERRLHHPGRGVQLLRRGGGWWVHHLVGHHHSHLAELRGDRLVPAGDFACGVSCSVDAHGRLLARRTSPGDDVVLLPSGERRAYALGHYDCFNHHLRIDGGDGLYFLRGTPPESHANKRLCRIDADGVVREGPAWDEAGSHYMSGSACVVRGRLFRSTYRHHPHPGKGRLAFDLMDLRTGERRWDREVDGLATALVPFPDRPWVAWALNSGRLGVFDVERGEDVWQTSLAVDGVAAVALSLALRGDQLAVGTVEGRVLVMGAR